jgi:hypothetical protein
MCGHGRAAGNRINCAADAALTPRGDAVGVRTQARRRNHKRRPMRKEQSRKSKRRPLTARKMRKNKRRPMRKRQSRKSKSRPLTARQMRKNKRCPMRKRQSRNSRPLTARKMRKNKRLPVEPAALINRRSEEGRPCRNPLQNTCRRPPSTTQAWRVRLRRPRFAPPERTPAPSCPAICTDRRSNISRTAAGARRKRSGRAG